ncbi:MAG: AAA family ATPase [Terriglobales bacterium]
MLKLKKLQILGFKSFCDRTELKFHGEGIAAIVGPNGCGKSNISDAISWVLGEQSAKTLRGTRMEDVIFAGTPARKPTGMAEVSLTLIDPEVYEGGDLSAEPEIEICDELPEEDWDEESLRAAAEAETERAFEEVRPLDPVEVAVSAPAAQASDDGGAAAVSGGEDASATAGEDAGATSEIAGESGRATTAAGQVVLKIRRRKFKPMPLQKGEIIVTRRLFRSGESEYLLNHKLCRLRDIQDIFMGTGVGPESYAIIEQGRIGQILSSKPTDRRAIIEEAAGITKFKTRKRLSEARLEDSRQNLARVNDIFEEVTHQMNSLKRQASKAARYAKLREEMRARLRLVLASKFAQLEKETGARQAELEAIAAEMRTQGERVRQMEAEQAERTQRGYAIESASRENRERLNAIALETDRATARRRQNEERCLELDARSAAAENELAQISSKLEALENERAANRQALESAAGDVVTAQQELGARQQDANAAAVALSDLEHEQELRRVAILEAANRASLARNRVTQAEEHIAGLGREAQRLTNEITASKLQLESFGGERGQITLEFDSVSQRVASLAAQIRELRQQLEAKRNDETESKRRLDGLRAEYASALGKKSSLEAVITEHGYSTESVRRLFRSGALQNGFAPVGVLADFLEVEDRYEHVVEDFLRDELNYVVVKSWDAATEGLRLLRTDVDGRATFLVHPDDSQARFSFVLDESVRPALCGTGALAGACAAEGGCATPPVVPLKNCIRVLDGFGKSLEVILPKLRDGYIVPDAGTGRELALENPDAFFLSQSGECFHNVTVTGGKQPAEGPLSMKRELRELLRQMAELEQTLRNEEARVQTLGREISELTSLLDRLEEEKREGEKLAITSGHTLHQLDAEMARVRERLETYERELQRVTAERAWKDDFIAAERQELSGIEQGRTELEQAMSAAQAELGALRQSRDAAAQSASEVLARVAALEERRRAAAATLERIELLVAEVAGRLGALRAVIESAVAEKEQRTAENLRLAEELASLASEREHAQARDVELQRESEQVRARLAELEEQLRAARQELDLARDRRGEVVAALAKLESDAAHMSDTCVQELGVTRDELRADASLEIVEGEQLTAEDAAYRELRARIESMGPVNMMALDEYNEVAQRHAFLETQRKDLLDAIENLQSTIREIETISREKFNEAFEKINQNFQSSFRKLFGGGHAFMRLTDAENSMESGIDVVASPPGKRLQNVLLLSGGEKALTALALLLGIFQYQPSPFCILDEVDAPLDEANIGRFNELVREMSMRTQFVLITHSKKTMSIAPVMYGVTMQEPGVSKLVSVRFEQTAN